MTPCSHPPTRILWRMGGELYKEQEIICSAPYEAWRSQMLGTYAACDECEPRVLRILSGRG